MQIPIQLAKDNKKFQISKVATSARVKEYRGYNELLRDTGILKIEIDEWKNCIYYAIICVFGE